MLPEPVFNRKLWSFILRTDCREAERVREADTRITPHGLPVNSMRTLLDHLGSLIFNQIALTGNPEHTFNVATEPAPLQLRAFQLLELDPNRLFPVEVQAP